MIRVTKTLTSYFEIISKVGVGSIDYGNFTTSSEFYETKLKFIVTKLTEILYLQGYAPFKVCLIHQKKHKAVQCEYNDVLKFDYGFCIDTSIDDTSVINNDPSNPENHYQSKYGLEGLFHLK